eukprot:TRINITY_DN13935_c0_g2_i1.p1 TRINITY_DN13935_c0_g2~~TRINITY_DN13935_c0_g2_i1.p1  ORF type:complete len:219 (-),score=26.24 TRINITY_DN13935_c0_g2_i1:45-701(-)
MSHQKLPITGTKAKSYCTLPLTLVAESEKSPESAEDTQVASLQPLKSPAKVLQKRYNPFIKRMTRKPAKNEEASNYYSRRKGESIVMEEEYMHGGVAEERKTMGPMVYPEYERPSIALLKPQDSRGSSSGLNRLANEPEVLVSPRVPRHADRTDIDVKGLDAAQSIERLQRELHDHRVKTSSAKNEITGIPCTLRCYHCFPCTPVSYTHLTLPTICSV